MTASAAVATVRDLALGLRERCDTIPGLRCYDIMSPKPEPPAVCVNGPIRWSYDETMDAYWRPVFELWVYVNPANLVDAQRQLYAYVAPTGRQSLPAALYADTTRGGVAQDVRVLGGVRPASLVETAGGSLLGLALEVEVWAM